MDLGHTQQAFETVPCQPGNEVAVEDLAFYLELVEFSIHERVGKLARDALGKNRPHGGLEP